MNTLLSMKVFRQVVESGSFVGAAARLNLSTAMTSKHLVHLEEHLGTRLLNRSSRSSSLTESGKLFLERCKVILEELTEAESAVGSVTGVPRGAMLGPMGEWLQLQVYDLKSVTLKDEGHWLSRSGTRLQMLQSSLAFLRAHNPPD